MDNKYDKLEQYFRRAILNDNNGEELLPPDHIFNNAMHIVNAKKKKRRALIIPFLLTLSIVLCGLLIYGLYELNSLKKELANHNNKFAINEKKIDQSPLVTNTVIDDIKNIKTPITENFHFNNVLPVNTYSENKIGKGININPEETISKSINDITSPTREAKDATITNNETTLSIPVNDYSRTINIEDLKLIDHKIKKQKEISAINFGEILLPKNNENDISTKNLAVGLNSNINVSFLSMTNVQVGSKTQLIDYDKYQTGKGISLYVDKKVRNNYNLQLLVGVQNYTNKSTLKDKLYYNPNYLTHLSNGDMYYQSEVNLLNPLGDIRSSTMIPLKEKMNENDEIREENKICQNFTSATLGLILHRNILSYHRLAFGAGLGYSYNYIIRSSNEFDVTLVSQNFTHKYYEEMSMLDKIKNHYSMLHAQINIDYTLTDKWAIDFRAGYSQSINSLRSISVNSDPKTYLNNYNVGIGMKYFIK